MKLLSVLLCTLLLISCVSSRGARGGGGYRGGSRSSSRTSSRTSTASRGTRYYSRASYSRSTVLTYMSLWAYSRIGYSRASYYRYNQADPEYCVYCLASQSNDSCVDSSKTVCLQSSDCYYMSYTAAANNTALIEKGCLYEKYGDDGCAAKVKECKDAGNANCTCAHCSDPYCNSAGRAISPILGLIIAGICSYLLARLGSF